MDTVAKMLKLVVLHSEHKRREQNLDDPAKGTMRDGITTFAELKDVSEALLYTPAGRLCATGLRDRSMQLVLHHAMMRYGNVHTLRMSHLFCVNLPYHSFNGECLGLMAVTSEGKTNRTGRKDLTGMLRNKDPYICPVGAWALYLFERFQLRAEVMPDLTDRRAWYGMPAFCDKGPMDPVVYNTFYHRCKPAYNRCGLKCSKATHCGRASGARMAQVNGASIESIRIHGGWNTTAMDQSYLTEIPRESMMASAGFSPKLDTYHIDRDDIQPSDDLLKMVFPFAEAMTTGQDVASRNCKDMFLMLRKVIIQDLAVMLAFFQDADHHIARCSLVSSPEFIDYQERLLAHLAQTTMPIDRAIARVQPLVAEALRINGQHMSLIGQQVDALGARVELIHDSLTGQGDHISRMAAWQEHSNMTLLNFFNRIEQGELVVGFRDSRPGTVAAPAPTVIAPQPNLVQTPAPAAAISTQNSSSASEAPTIAFRMEDRGIVATVPQAYTEWYIGLDGKMSVEEAVRLHGTSWMQSSGAKKHYSRHGMIMKAINEYASSKRVTKEVAAAAIERLRNGKALSTFAEDLHKKRINFN